MTFMPESKLEAIKRLIDAGLTLQNSQARALWDALQAAEARIKEMERKRQEDNDFAIRFLSILGLGCEKHSAEARGMDFPAFCKWFPDSCHKCDVERIAELTATIEGQRLALEELERQMNEEKLKHEDMRVHLRGIIWELRLWAQEAQTHLQNTLWQLGNSAPLEAFLTRPLPGEEDR